VSATTNASTPAGRTLDQASRAGARSGSPRRARSLQVNVCRLTVAAVVLGAWQLSAERGWVDRGFTRCPSDIASALWKYAHSGQLASSTGATLFAEVVAFVIGSLGGVLAGFALGSSEFADRVFGPFVVPLNSIPRIALAPLFILWFGLTSTAKIALAVTVVFFVMLINARASVKTLDPDIATMARVVGIRRTAFLAKILWPSAVPTVFAGIRLSITYSLLGVVASEMIAARNGLGQDVVRYSAEFDVASMFAVLVWLSLIATIISVGFDLLERRLLRWQATH
jgi:NitT/TauT family transport system permease protein